ncbi:MAG TPA: hypothetical protein PKZ41_02380 [Candidatus Omnitrophota bacterium]|nr:hypothetical protein [Candidatus Omnitrophota bacterium]
MLTKEDYLEYIDQIEKVERDMRDVYARCLDRVEDGAVRTVLEWLMRDEGSHVKMVEVLREIVRK